MEVETRNRNNTPVYPSSIPDLMLPGRYFGLVVHCWAPLSSASELMHSYTSDPSPSPLHLVVVKVPRRQIQCSSYYHQLFNFFVNVGMVWCLMSYPWYVHLHEIRSFDVWFRYQKVWYGRGRWRTPMWTEMFPSLIFLYNRFHSNSSGDSVWESVEFF